MKRKFALIIIEVDEDENGIVDECILDEDIFNLGDADIKYIVEETPESSKLTDREKEVLTSILKGKRRVDTASELFISESTVKKHSRAIYSKFGVKNRFELLSKIYRSIHDCK